MNLIFSRNLPPGNLTISLLQVTVASRMAAGDFVVDEEHLSGFVFEGMPTELTALTVYRAVDGKIARLMLLF